jgi:PAS domain S-box-containing protein
LLRVDKRAPVPRILIVDSQKNVLLDQICKGTSIPNFQEINILQSEDLKHQILNRLGFVPAYLEDMSDSPVIMDSIWNFTLSAYLNNPLPEKFKEKALALFSKSGNTNYPLMLHSSNLYKLGMSPDDIINLLEFPVLSYEQLKNQKSHLLEINQEWTNEESNQENFLLLCCYSLYQKKDRQDIFKLLKSLLPVELYDQVTIFISFSRSYFEWFESHPDVKIRSQQIHDQINNLIDREPKFEKIFAQTKIEQEAEFLPETQDDQKFIRFFDNTPVAICLYKTDGYQIELVNSKFREYLSAKESIKPDIGCLTDAMRDELLTYLEKVRLSNEYLFVNDMQFRHTDNSDAQYFDVTFQPISNDKNEVTHIMQISVDVTEQVTAKMEINKSYVEVSKVADCMPQIVFKTNTEGKVIYINTRWTEYSGSNNPDDWEKYVHPDDYRRATALWKNSIYSGKSFEAEFRLKKITGIYQWHLVRALPFKSPEGEVIQWIGTCTNIEEQKNLAHKVTLANKLVENEKQKFESIFSEAPAAMAILKGATLIFEKANASYFKFTGERDIIGKPLEEAFPELKKQPYLDIITEVFYTGITFSSKESLVMIKGANGDPETLSSKFFDLTFQRMDGPDGNPYGVFIFATDVSEKVLSRHSIQESEKEFRTLAEAMPQIIFVANPNGEITYFNDKWEQFTGYSFEQTKSWSWSPVHHPEDLDRLITTWNESLTTGKPYQIEYRLKGKNGTYRWFLGRALPVRDNDGRILKWIGTNTDIHDQKILEQKLESAIDQIQYSQRLAESANEAKSYFLANMSHEIRTPLGAIMGFVGLMKNPNIKTEDLQKYISITQRNAEQLLIIIDDILDLSKVEAGRLEIEKINLNLEELLLDFNSSMDLRASENGITFKISAKSPIPHNIISDPTRIKQILMNVVGNAIKFTHQGTVELIVSYEDTMLEFTVKDTGVGIDSEQAKALFQPFTQADTSTTRKYGGTGLGLVLTQKLCEAMGGKFVLKESEVEKGSTFVALIKISVPHDVKFFENFKASSEVDSRKEVDKSVLAGVKILIVDDLEDNLTLLNVILSEAGASVVTESDAFEGIRLAIERKFDIVLMDIQMPLLNGYEVMKKIKKSGNNVPIIALTAHAMKDERERALKNGFSEFLAKPLKSDLLIETINKLNKQHQYVPPPSEKILIVEDDHDLRDLLEVLLSSKGLDVTTMETGEALLNYLATNETPKLILVDLALPFMSGNELIPILNKRSDRSQYKVIIASGWDDLPSRAKILKADGYLKKPYNPQTIGDNIKKLLPSDSTSSK